MSQTIKKVALAGASGQLGRSILHQLTNSGFEVTVLSRQTSSHSFPPAIRVRSVDYEDQNSLTSALQGQDAVVSSLANAALDHQILLINSAAIAGVYRFVPSEYGSDTSDEKCAGLPVYQKKIACQKLLKDLANSTSLTWTAICSGPFLDWGLRKGFMDIKAKRVSLYDGGNRVFSTTTLDGIGKAVSGVLLNPVPTENRIVRVHEIATTQSDLLARAKEVVGSNGWKVDTPSINELVGTSWVNFKQGRRDLGVMIGFIVAAAFGEGYGVHFEQNDNDLLKLPQLGNNDIRKLVEEAWKE